MILRGSEVAQISTFGLEQYDIVNDIEVEGKAFSIKSNQQIIENLKRYISTADIEFNYNNN